MSDTEVIDDILELSSDTECDSDEEGPSPAKKRKTDANSENHSFKEKVQKILEELSDDAPGPFVASGRINAPMTTIAVKVCRAFHYASIDVKLNKNLSL